MRRSALDEFDREFSACATPESRTDPIGDLLREPAWLFRSQRAGALDRSLDELPISDAVANADVHDSFDSVEPVPSVNEND